MINLPQPAPRTYADGFYFLRTTEGNTSLVKLFTHKDFGDEQRVAFGSWDYRGVIPVVGLPLGSVLTPAQLRPTETPTNDLDSLILERPSDSVVIEVGTFLLSRLKMWEDSGEAAPVNELQSIYAWSGQLANTDRATTLEVMRTRITLLLKAASALHKAGPEAEAAAGIYDNRPDLKPEVEEGQGHWAGRDER